MGSGEKAWECLERAEQVEAVAELLRRGRAFILLPWAHPACVPTFRPPFDWDWVPRKPISLGRRLLFGLLQVPPRWEDSTLIPGEQVRSVLLFRYDAIGDYIVTTPLLRFLRQGLPQARITVVTSTRNDMLAAGDPHVDRHVPLHPQHAFHPSWLKRAAQLRGDYDVVFALVFTHMSKAAFLARSMAPGAEYIAPWHGQRAAVYGRVFHRQPRIRRWQQHWAELLLQVGLQTLRPASPVEPQQRPYVPISPRACQRVWEQLQRWGLGTCAPQGPLVWEPGAAASSWEALSGTPYVVINVSSHTDNRSWLLHHALLVCRELLRRLPEVELLFIASPQQWRRVENLVQLLAHPRCRAFRGSFADVVALVAGAAWVATPDTAIVHVASALGKPVVGLYGELIKVVEWYPFGVPFVLVVSSVLEGVSFLPPGAVVEAVERLLQQVIPSGFVLPKGLQPIPAASSAAATGAA